MREPIREGGMYSVAQFEAMRLEIASLARSVVEQSAELDRLREAVEWLAHESVCGATKRFVEQFPDLAYLIWVPDGA